MENFQNNLDELNSYLNRDEELLNKEEVNRIEELFLSLSDDEKTEDIIVKTLKKIHAFSDKDNERNPNADGIKKVCKGIPTVLRNQDLFFKVVDEIKEYQGVNGDELVTRIDNNVLRVFAGEMKEILQNEKNLFTFLDKVKEYAYKPDLKLINPIMCQWVLDNVPDNLASKDFYMKLIERIPNDVNLLIDRINKKNLDKQLIDAVVSKMDKSYFGAVNSLINGLPADLKNQEYITDIINKFDKEQYDVITLWKHLPAENKTQDMFLLLAQKASLQSANQFIKNMPEEFSKDEVYKTLISQASSKKYISSDNLKEYFNKIPKEYFSEENLISVIDDIEVLTRKQRR